MQHFPLDDNVILLSKFSNFEKTFDKILAMIFSFKLSLVLFWYFFHTWWTLFPLQRSQSNERHSQFTSCTRSPEHWTHSTRKSSHGKLNPFIVNFHWCFVSNRISNIILAQLNQIAKQKFPYICIKLLVQTRDVNIHMSHKHLICVNLVLKLVKTDGLTDYNTFTLFRAMRKIKKRKKSPKWWIFVKFMVFPQLSTILPNYIWQ